jgi:serine protease Do
MFVDRKKGRRMAERYVPVGRCKFLWLQVAIVILILVLHAGVQADEPASTVQSLGGLSGAFTRIAKQSIPAVVYIEVEKTLNTRQGPFNFGDPSDLFNDQFFRRFFGNRFHKAPKQYRQKGLGSGFIISHDGYILTNYHVVGGADRIMVKLSDGRQVQAKLIGSDPKSDVAVIKIAGDNLPVLPLGNSDTLEVGEWVMAIGNPFGLTHTITVGVVSAKGRSGMGIEDYEDFIQTDAAINPGNSGGPLLNLQGEVVGINTAIFSRSGGYMGIGFAIPINMVSAIEKQLIATGKVTRGYLGVRIQDLSDELARSFGLKSTRGVLIAEVAKGSPADKGGLKAGDVIVAYDGKAVSDTSQLRNLVAMTSPGSSVKVEVVRDGAHHELAVTIEELTKNVLASSGNSDLLERLGFTVQELTPDLAQQFGYEEEKGVLVAQVEAGSPAESVGIRPGMLIREVNRKAVHDIATFMRALAESKKTERVLFLLQDKHGTRFVALGLR